MHDSTGLGASSFEVPIQDSRLNMTDSAISLNNSFIQQRNQLLVLLNKMEDIVGEQKQLEKLKERITSNRALLLVTGDLNSGKSTFCNTLLKRRIVHENNEPSNAMFVEIIDSKRNGGRQEVHMYRNASACNQPDVHDFKDLEQILEEQEESQDCELIKIYVENGNDLLSNDLIEISLIDSPGLNINSIKTSALFGKEKDIDIILFVVNAENHFTQSAREFLKNAAKEKQYVFIVVNKFDNIKRQERNRKEILSQIQEISPFTFQNSDELVHFVSAKKAYEQYQDQSGPQDWAFEFKKLGMLQLNQKNPFAISFWRSVQCQSWLLQKLLLLIISMRLFVKNLQKLKS
jgi:mitofusin